MPFGSFKGSLFSFSPGLITALVAGLEGTLGEAIDVIYTAYKHGSYEYRSGAERETVHRVILLETYPFLWTTFVLFWTYAITDDDDTANDRLIQPPVPEAALEVYLCVWRDIGRFVSLMKREGRVPISTLKAPCIKSTKIRLEEPILVYHQLSSFDLLNTSNRMATAICDRIDEREMREEASATEMYESFMERKR